ncbi:Exocyst complex component 5 [Datura stramonium]|uniref:Exocyst complex component 5 n=1 Tax=Datura stramonium TaxID=4076 RepID=A0ABS8S7U3_DATST|nr:Exocyst complex component 5 [Datura stramonium]
MIWKRSLGKPVDIARTMAVTPEMSLPCCEGDNSPRKDSNDSDSNGGLRLKRDITEYGEFVRSFNAPQIDEKFEQLGIIANVFIVAPESLGPLIEGTPSIKKDAQRFIQLRDDYKNAKLASRLSSLWN